MVKAETTTAPQTQLHPIIKQILEGRGYRDPATIDAFLRPDYDRHLYDPFLMCDMEPAVKRILQAVKRREKVVIYGDYDIDGITASAVMLETMVNLGHSATSYIPDRFEEGYGINLEALQKLKAEGTDLVITVDCGVTSVTEIDWANANGLDVIVTDHHVVPDEIPKALAVINPKRPDDRYPFKDLAGVGVAFKLATALQARGGRPAGGQEKWLLDLVALGTVCDVVTLVGENRVLAQYGLKVLNRTRRVGLEALVVVAGSRLGAVTSYHLGFILGPRMNAAGRLEHAARSLELVTTANPRRAQQIAAELNELNRQRQADQARILAAADQQASSYRDDPVLVLAAPDWSHGIVGIVASKLVEKWRKPALVMQIMGDTAKGSARSTGNFDLIAGLRAVSRHFSRFGGHRLAAGYTLPVSSIESLRRDLVRYYRSLKLPADTANNKLPEYHLDDLGVLDRSFYELLCTLEPYGHGNPRPIFNAALKLVQSRPVGQTNDHLKLTLSDGIRNQLDGIAFGLGGLQTSLVAGNRIDVNFQLDLNEYNGRSNLQLLVTDLKP